MTQSMGLFDLLDAIPDEKDKDSPIPKEGIVMKSMQKIPSASKN